MADAPDRPDEDSAPERDGAKTSRPGRAAALALGAFVAFLALLAGTGAWLLGTQSGLDRVLAFVRHVGGVSILATGARGRLIGPLAIERLEIDHERVHVVVEQLAADLDLTGIPFLKVTVREARIARADVQVKARTKPPTDEPPQFLPGPLRLGIERFSLAHLTVRAPSGTAIEIADLGGRVAISHKRLVVSGGHADGGAWTARGDAELRAADPLGLAARGEWEVRAGGHRLAGSGEADGDLERLVVHGRTREPAGASFDGRLRLVDEFRFDGDLALGDFDPAALGAGSFLGPLGGRLAVAGTVAAFTARGRVSAAHEPLAPLGALDVDFEGGYAAQEFSIRRAVAGTRGGLRASATGHVDLRGETTLHLAGDWANLRWPLAGRPAVVLPSGRYTLEGAKRYAWTASAAVRGPSLPPAEVRARGDLDPERLRVASFEADVLRGRVAGSGELAFAGDRGWRAALSGQRLDFGVVRAPLAGRVDLALEASGRGFEPTGEWDARLSRLAGTVRGLPAHGRGAARMRAGQLAVDGLDVAFGSAVLRADGTLGRRHSDLEWRLRLDDLGSFLAGGRGSVRSRGAVQGENGRISVQGTVGGRGLEWAGWKVAQVVADVDVDTTDHDESYVKLVAQKAGRDNWLADELRVTLDGRATDHRLLVRGTSGADWLELVTRGSYRPDPATWTVQVEDFRVQGPPLLSYRLEQPSTLTAREDGVLLTATCFVRDVERVCAAGTFSTKVPWAMTLHATDMPLRLLPLALPKGTEYGGTVAVEGTVRGAPATPWTGEAALGFTDAEFRYRTASRRMDVVRLGSGRVEARAAPEAFLAEVGLGTVAGSSLTGNARVERGVEPPGDAPLSGHVALETRELAWLPLFVPAVDRFAGRLASQVTLAGTLDAPQLDGFVEFADGEIDVYRTNLLLKDVNARITLAGNRIGLDGRATTKGGTATARGDLEWRDRQPYGALTFEGKDLLVADLPEAHVTASPNLEFKVAGRRLDVSGEVRIPTARLQPKDLRGAVLPSGDEVIVGRNAEPEREGGFLVNAAVRLVLGDDVKVNAYGLTGKLGGNLLVTARPNEVPIGSGELNVKEGKYSAYTRELDIDRGRLLFAGQDVSNPGLDIRAQRKIVNARTGADVIAGINVRGTLLKPQISFYSDPAMSQSQIASMIIVGRTLDDIQDADRSTLGGADTRTALTAQGSALLAGQLGRYVGIDDVAVEQGANNATSVVIGKFLSPRLYVSYGVSLTETINTLKLRYTIGDRWVIKTESGVRQSADIEYTIEH
jgi:translocation and assembly module TamB